MPRLTFTPGEILTAANLNVVSDQTVMVFDDAAARTTAIPSPTEGMVTYLKDTDNLEKYTTDWVDAAPGKILQVVQTIKTDTFSSTSDSYADITGLTVTITPSSASNRVLLLADVKISPLDIQDLAVHLRLNGGNSGTYIGDSAGNRISSASAAFGNAGTFELARNANQVNINYVDSPATTSAITYSVQMRRSGASNTIFVNRGGLDADSAARGRTASSLIAMEVAG